jgi:hypothetical protein
MFIGWVTSVRRLGVLANTDMPADAAGVGATEWVASGSPVCAFLNLECYLVLSNVLGRQNWICRV